MAFIEPMHCNKPNITYLLASLLWVYDNFVSVSYRTQRLCQLELWAPGRFNHAGQALCGEATLNATHNWCWQQKCLGRFSRWPCCVMSQSKSILDTPWDNDAECMFFFVFFCHELTVKHILIECNFLKIIRRRHYDVTDLNQLFKTVSSKRILDFVKDIRLYNSL